MTQAQNLAVSSSQINSSGVLLPAGGGTGVASFPAPGTSGNILSSNGTIWTSATNPPPFVSGTLMLFQQTASPTGWTKQTTHNDKALRVVSGTTSSGGSVGFTTAFASQAVSGTVGTSGSSTVTGTSDATTLSTAQMPSHTHTYNSTNPAGGGCSGAYSGTGPGQLSFSTGSQGGGGSHTHTFTSGGHTHTAGAFSGTAINLAVSYVDLIIASKD